MRKDIILAIAETAAAVGAGFLAKKKYDEYKIRKDLDIDEIYECKLLHIVLIFNAEETMQIACFDKYAETGEITITLYSTDLAPDIFGYQDKITHDMDNMLVIRRKDGTYKWISALS